MKVCGWLLVVVACVQASVYQPGQPGGPWTKEELLIVKSKLYRLFKQKIVLAPRMVRLGFHDCLKYKDGSGGCDGCLDWHGVGVTFKVDWVAKNNTNVETTTNNFLEEAVYALEFLYTRTDYPNHTPDLQESLKDSGKSRADLWAYAATVAVEFGIQYNNEACKRANGGHFADTRVCVHDSGPDCEVKLKRPFTFEYGRADCESADGSYKAVKDELHPDPQANGVTTVQFMKDNFDFDGRETAAIMGAHTFGKPTVTKSLFPYLWTSSGRFMFNNDYFKSMVGQERWYFDDDNCNPVGNAFNEKPKPRWIAHARMITLNGGTIFWIKETHTCPNPYNDKWHRAGDKECLDEAPEGQVCKADSPADSDQPRLPSEEDATQNGGCEKYRFITGRDEVALNTDLGLYLDFNVTDGYFHGCPGLEHFKDDMANTQQTVNSKLPGIGRAQPLCGKQMHKEPSGAKPMYEIMEEFANDQSAWIEEYQAAHEKMLRNGVETTLTAAPDHSTHVVCPLPTWDGYGVCYEVDPAAGNGPIFKLASKVPKLAGRFADMDPDTGATTMALENDETTQQWQWSNSDDQLVNVGSGLPLLASKFVREEKSDVWILKESDTNKAVTTKKKKLVLKKYKGRRNQKFYPVYLDESK